MKAALLLNLILLLNGKTFSQSPDWGTLTALDKAELIVTGKMKVTDLYEGLGTLKITEVIKGETKLKEVKVQFTNRYPRKENTKQEEAPKYWYSNDQEGIYILTGKNSNSRYELRQANVYLETKWKKWAEEKLLLLKEREWSVKENGLSGSIIIDSIGNNKFYRFFYICLRNDSDSSMMINTHYRIKESSQQRITASMQTPENNRIDMLSEENPDCRLRGEPGWPTPDLRDFRELKPGKTIYLVASGVLSCFLKDLSKGEYCFYSTYENKSVLTEVKGKIWRGKITFPVAGFWY